MKPGLSWRYTLYFITSGSEKLTSHWIFKAFPVGFTKTKSPVTCEGGIPPGVVDDSSEASPKLPGMAVSIALIR